MIFCLYNIIILTIDINTVKPVYNYYLIGHVKIIKITLWTSNIYIWSNNVNKEKLGQMFTVFKTI